MSIYCPSCKSANDDSASFCSTCGARLKEEQKPAATGQPATHTGWRPSGTAASGKGSGEPKDAGKEKKDKEKLSETHEERPKGETRMIGCARNVHKAIDGNKNNEREVWTFRLERYDKVGNRLTPVPVQVRSKKFNLNISEGDEVEVKGKWHKDEFFKASKIYNRTSKSKFKFHWNWGFLKFVLLAPWYLIYAFFWVAGAILVFYFIYIVIKVITEG